MNKNTFETVIAVTFDSEHVIHDDSSTVLLRETKEEEELPEEDLELVSAAATPSYQSFLSRVKKENE